MRILLVTEDLPVPILGGAGQHAVLLGKNAVIGLADLPTHLVARGDGAVSVEHALSRQLTLHELEREYIDKTLEATRGNKTEAARILGVDRTTLYRKLDEYKLKN